MAAARDDPRTFGRNVSRRQRRWHARIVADWKAFDDLDDTGLEVLRKRIERRRDAVEFFAPVLRRRQLERDLDALAVIQDRMGTLNDRFVARTCDHREHSRKPAAAALLDHGRRSARAALRSDARVHNGRMSNDDVPAFRPLTGIYEPSAIQQLPDGRFLVVEDEKEHPLSLVTIGADGTVKTTALTAGLLQMFSSFWKLDDLEGLAADRAGFVYAITSHSRDDDGEEKKSREKLARFRVEDDRVMDPKIVDGLKHALTARHAVLAAAAKVRDVKASGGLNIEGLEISPDQRRLLIGFRSPLRGGHALIASVENPSEIFESDEAPRIAPLLEELDLGGHGIRGLSYVPALGAYLVIGGPTSREPGNFDLWRWSGEPGAPVRRMTVPGLRGLEKAEGVTPAVVAGMERIVVVSDDGNRGAGRPASYLLLDPAELRTAA